MLDVRNYIRGEWLVLRDGRELELRNPADLDEVLCRGHMASTHHAEAAIEAAHSALGEWSRMPAPKRGEIVERAADILKSELDDVARLLTREEGKALVE